MNGQGVVIATCDKTFKGRMTQRRRALSDNEDTFIAKEINYFMHKVNVIDFVLGISFLIIDMVKNGDIIDIIVASVPEFLLATVTASLTLTAPDAREERARQEPRFGRDARQHLCDLQRLDGHAHHQRNGVPARVLRDEGV